MFSKTATLTVAALALSAGFASAQPMGKSQAGAAPFDQGGIFQRSMDTSTSSDVYGGNIDRGTTASIGKVMRQGEGQKQIRSVFDNNASVPADTRNERGLGIFDRVD